MISRYDQGMNTPNETPRPMPVSEPASRSHPECWQGDHYEHSCHEPSGRSCVECGAPAGTPWGPYFCPECDVIRLDRIEANLRAALNGGDA